MGDHNGKCDSCGRFMRYDAPGASWANKYDMVAYEQICVATRCPKCTDALGPVLSNAIPYDGDMTPYERHYPKQQ